MDQESTDYLLIGHVTEDLQTDGSIALGGTVTYSGLTAKALGHKPAILTSCAADSPVDHLASIPMKRVDSEKATRFRNIPSNKGRLQYLFSQATPITEQMLPLQWVSPAIVHIAPVFNDVDPSLLSKFPNSLRCLTPQGWMREVDEHNAIRPKSLEGLENWLTYAHIIVLSFEDLQGDLKEAERISKLVSILVMTERDRGARVFYQGKTLHIEAPHVDLVDDTGSGDIFAACFFHNVSQHKNPWKAARFAVELASQSVSRKHLESIPSPIEIQKAHELASEQGIYD